MSIGGGDEIGTADVYDSPYFGRIGSGSIGRRMDREYEQSLSSGIPYPSTGEPRLNPGVTPMPAPEIGSEIGPGTISIPEYWLRPGGMPMPGGRGGGQIGMPMQQSMQVPFYAQQAPMPIGQFDNTGRNMDPSLLAQQLILGQPAAGMQAIPQASQQFSRPSYQPLMTPDTYQNFYANNRPAASIYSPLEVPRFERYVEPIPISPIVPTPVNRVIDSGGGYDGGYDSGFGGGGGATFGGSGSLGISDGGSGTVGAPGAGTAEGDAAGNTEGSGGPADGSGTAGDSSCVIATHAVAHGSFTPREKKRAVVWCTRTLHNKWWGEVIRNGYRYHGNKAITAGEAHEYYDEFRDFIRFATGAKRNAKTAKVFAWRSVQFFFTGLFLKGY